MEKNRRRRDPVFAKKDEEEMRLAFSGYEAKREKEREKKKRKIRSNRIKPRGTVRHGNKSYSRDKYLADERTDGLITFWPGKNAIFTICVVSHP